jgi:hypothetical protein
MNDFTHLEIESLPGGFWGYDHFPMYARYYQNWGTEILAMTGRFHTSWGDFGGLRNRAALEFECFQGLAHGAKISIGDQLHPRGRLDKAVYQRIGEVYAEVEKREQWVEGSTTTAEIGVITSSGALGVRGDRVASGDVGVLHVLEQLKHQFMFLDNSSDLSPFQVVILPDTLTMDEGLAERLRTFLSYGGKLIVTGQAGVNLTRGDYLLAHEMGAHYAGLAQFTPDYLALADEISTGIEPMFHACELQGVNLDVEPGVTVLAYSGASYFNRTWEHFCSHQYTPMSHVSEEPVIVQNGSVLTIARPLFSEYAESAKSVHKKVIANCISRLLPAPRVRNHNLPSTAIVTVRKLRNDLIVHLLHYVHQRRGRVLDVIEDVIPLHNVEIELRANHQPTDVRLVPEDQSLQWSYTDGYIKLQIPVINGYQIVQIAGAE